MTSPSPLLFPYFVCALVCFGMPAVSEERSAAHLVAICAACHRLDGRNEGMPSITGLPAGDLVSAMWVFRSDERENAVMHAVSLTLSESETATLARRLALMGASTTR